MLQANNKNTSPPLDRESEDKIRLMMQNYGNDVLRTAFYYVKDYQAAEDIFQEVFLKAYRSLGSFKGLSSEKTWLIRITINACKDFLKSSYHQRVVPMFDYMEESAASDEKLDRVEKNEERQLVREAVMSLPEPYREMLVLVYFKEMQVKEAAAVMGIGENTAKSHLKRGREKLKKILERRL